MKVVRKERIARIARIAYSVLLVVLVLLSGCGTGSSGKSRKFEYKTDISTVSVPDTYLRCEYAAASKNGVLFYGINSSSERTLFIQEHGDGSLKELCSFPDLFYRDTFLDVSTGASTINILSGSESDGLVSFSIKTYSRTGEYLKETFLETERFLEDFPIKAAALSDGSFLVESEKSLCRFSNTGELLSEADCPRGSFKGLGSDGTSVIVTYGDKDTTAAEFNIETKDFFFQREIEGSGEKILVDGDMLYYLDEAAIRGIDLKSNVKVRHTSLVSDNSNYSPLAGFAGNPTAFMTYEITGDGKELTVTRYLEKEAAEQSANAGKTELVLYVTNNAHGEYEDIRECVSGFNKQSDEYKVILKKDTWEGDELTFAKDIAAGNYPDIVCTAYDQMAYNLLKNGFFEDLEHFFEYSSKYDRDDFDPHILDIYTKESQLFSLPNFYKIGVLIGYSSVFDTDNWTLTEFLDWGQSNPQDMNGHFHREEVYNLCMDAILREYRDAGPLMDYIASDEFRDLCVRIKNLEIREGICKSREEAEEARKKDRSGMLDSYFMYLSSLSQTEKSNGAEYVIKSYPGYSGEPVVYVESAAVGICSQSKYKEGAYDFLEYYLDLAEDDNLKEKHENGVYGFTSLKRDYRKDEEALLNNELCMYQENFVKKEKIDAVLELLPYVELRDYSHDDLKALIWEDMCDFLYNGKSLESVLDSVKRRVELYLSEKD